VTDLAWLGATELAKDTFDTAELRTTRGSRLFNRRVPRDVELALSVLAPGEPLSTSPREPRVGLVRDAFGPIDAEVAEILGSAAAVLGAEEAELPTLAATDCDQLTRVLYGARSRSYFAAVVGDRWDELHPALAGHPLEEAVVMSAGAALEEARGPWQRPPDEALSGKTFASALESDGTA
jgi:Asp-tRNA(Asn)/Glu-tRNA(Gln) amidotransferase A subunit family amidase